MTSPLFRNIPDLVPDLRLNPYGHSPLLSMRHHTTAMKAGSYRICIRCILAFITKIRVRKRRRRKHRRRGGWPRRVGRGSNSRIPLWLNKCAPLCPQAAACICSSKIILLWSEIGLPFYTCQGVPARLTWATMSKHYPMLSNGLHRRVCIRTWSESCRDRVLSVCTCHSPHKTVLS